MKRSKPLPKRDHNWLGADRERSIGHLQKMMSHTSDGKEKVILARQARKVRHGSDSMAPARISFTLGLRDLRLLNPIGVH
jgi:hypothetical protein